MCFLLYFLGAISFILWDAVSYNFWEKDTKLKLTIILATIFWPFVMIYALLILIKEFSLRYFRR